jgi:hypothetical protein
MIKIIINVHKKRIRNNFELFGVNSINNFEVSLK